MAQPTTILTSDQAVISLTDYWKTRKAMSTQTYTSRAVRVFENRRDGEKNNLWRFQVRNNQNATTPLTGWKFELVSRDFDHLLTYPLKPSAPSHAPVQESHTGQYENILDMAGLKTYVNGLSEVSADSRALGDLAEDTRDKHAQLKGGAMLGELTETLRLLRNPASALFGSLWTYGRALRANKSLRRLPKKHLDKALAESWLVYSFGVKPIISDLDDIMQYVDERYRVFNSENGWASGRGMADSLVLKTRMTQGYSQPADNVTRRLRGYVEVRYTSKLTINANSVSTPLTRWGFGPREWLPTLWELIPFSFVVDYFTNIQEIITSLSYINAGVYFTNKTVKKTIVEDYQLRFVSGQGIQYSYMSAPSYLTRTQPGSYSMTATKISRSKYSGSFIPRPDFTIPGMGLKWLNLAALGSMFRNVSRAIK